MSRYARYTPMEKDDAEFIDKFSIIDTNSEHSCIVKLVKCRDKVLIKDLLRRKSYLYLDILGSISKIVLASLPIKYTYVLHLGTDVKLYSRLKKIKLMENEERWYQMFDFFDEVDNEEFCRIRDMCSADIDKLMTKKQRRGHLNMISLRRNYLYTRLEVLPNEDDYFISKDNVFMEDEYKLLLTGTRKIIGRDELESHVQEYTLRPNHTVAIPDSVQLKKIRLNIDSELKLFHGTIYPCDNGDGAFTFRFTNEVKLSYKDFAVEETLGLDSVKSMISGVHPQLRRYFPTHVERIDEESLNLAKITEVDLELKGDLKQLENEHMYLTYYNVCV